MKTAQMYELNGATDIIFNRTLPPQREKLKKGNVEKQSSNYQVFTC